MSFSCPVCSNPETDLWCNAKDYEYFTSKESFEYYHCRNCKTIFLNPKQIKPLNEIYPSNYYAFKESGGSIIQTVKTFLDKKLFRKILSEIEGSELSVLDVGGGTGWLLDTVKQTDKRVTYTQVVDIDAKAEEKALKKGHNYFCGPIEQFETEKKFHFVLLLNLIEHVANPQEILQKVESILAPGGVILIKTPNIECWDVRLTKNKYWGGLHAPRHWVLFSSKSFEMITSRAGLSIKSLKYTQGAPFWAYSILSQWYERGLVKISPKKPLPFHPLAAPIMALSAAFDIIRGAFVKTSQMFIILNKKK